VRYAVYPPATSRWLGDWSRVIVARTELQRMGRCGRAENGVAVPVKGCTGERLSCDVGKVVISVHFVDDNALDLFSVNDHGVARGYPLGFGGYALASGSVDEHSGVGVYGGGQVGG